MGDESRIPLRGVHRARWTYVLPQPLRGLWDPSPPCVSMALLRMVVARVRKVSHPVWRDQNRAQHDGRAMAGDQRVSRA